MGESTAKRSMGGLLRSSLEGRARRFLDAAYRARDSSGDREYCDAADEVETEDIEDTEDGEWLCPIDGLGDEIDALRGDRNDLRDELRVSRF